MGNVINGHEGTPTSDSGHVVRGANEAEVLHKAAERAREHGLPPTPERLAKVESSVEDG